MLDDFVRPAANGRRCCLHGMGEKTEAFIPKALEERKRHAGRDLLPNGQNAAAALVSYLSEHPPGATIAASTRFTER